MKNLNKKSLFFAFLFFIISVNIVMAEETSSISKNKIDNKVTKEKEWNIPFGGFYISVGECILVAGGQKDLVNNSVTPKPDALIGINYRVGAFVYFFDYYGIDVSYLFTGKLYASSLDIPNDLGLFDYSILNGGILFRYPIRLWNNSTISIFAGAGINRSSLVIAGDYKKLIISGAEKEGYSISFSDNNATGIGWYFKTGSTFFMFSHFFVGCELGYAYYNTKFPTATKKLDGHNIDLSIKVGVSI